MASRRLISRTFLSLAGYILLALAVIVTYKTFFLKPAPFEPNIGGRGQIETPLDLERKVDTNVKKTTQGDADRKKKEHERNKQNLERLPFLIDPSFESSVSRTLFFNPRYSIWRQQLLELLWVNKQAIASSFPNIKETNEYQISKSMFGTLC